VRPASPGDEADVVRLWHEVFGYPEARNAPARVWAELLEHGTVVLLAELSGRVVGSIVVGYDGHRGWLYRLAVHAEARRQGVGSELVREAERVLAGLGCAKVNLQLHGHNHDGARFWKAVGYQLEERISMGKDLTDPGCQGDPGC
jgi:ribosomal protein S18 acetylase RimI-like enzyme